MSLWAFITIFLVEILPDFVELCESFYVKTTKGTFTSNKTSFSLEDANEFLSVKSGDITKGILEENAKIAVCKRKSATLDLDDTNKIIVNYEILELVVKCP